MASRLFIQDLGMRRSPEREVNVLYEKLPKFRSVLLEQCLNLFPSMSKLLWGVRSSFGFCRLGCRRIMRVFDSRKPMEKRTREGKGRRGRKEKVQLTSRKTERGSEAYKGKGDEEGGGKVSQSRWKRDKIQDTYLVGEKQWHAAVSLLLPSKGGNLRHRLSDSVPRAQNFVHQVIEGPVVQTPC
jgi:hypothetical protein